MQLIKTTNDFIKNLKNLDNLRDQAVNFKAFETRRDQLKEPVEHLLILLDIFEVLMNHSLQVDLDSEELKNLKGQLINIHNSYKENPENLIAENKAASYKFWTPLKKLPERISEKLSEEWKAYIKKKRSVVNEDILDVFYKMPGFKKQVQTIRKIFEEMDRLCASLPNNEAVFGRIEKLSNNLVKSWKDLKGDEIPNDVLEFIKQATSEGVALTNLTPNISKWLTKQDLKGIFQIIVPREE